MKVRQVFALGVLTLATGAVFAATPLMNGEGSTRGDQGSGQGRPSVADGGQ